MDVETLRARVRKLREEQLDLAARVGYQMGETAGRIKALEELAGELERALEAPPVAHVNGAARPEEVS